jgi:hypothetical protein
MLLAEITKHTKTHPNIDIVRFYIKDTGYGIK